MLSKIVRHFLDGDLVAADAVCSVEVGTPVVDDDSDYIPHIPSADHV